MFSVTKPAWPGQPAGVVGANVCWDWGNVSGKNEVSAEGTPLDPTAAAGCQTRFEYFLEGAEGSRIEAGAKDILIDKRTGQEAAPDTPPEFLETQNHPFLLDPLGTLVCLNCPIASASATIRYPLR